MATKRRAKRPPSRNSARRRPASGTSRRKKAATAKAPSRARRPTRAQAEALRERHPFGGVSKDPLDLRDLMYEGSLLELPRSIDNRPRVPMILNQGREGACTGFGLAAVVNYLLANRSGARRPRESVSSRMLYELAKRYDEWKGENYDGSSIRGAMKGWHRHGVCRESRWPYVEDDAGRLTERAETDALERPLGSYFRVRHLHLNHMHSALREAGTLYASGDVHEGWYEVDSSSGKIPFRAEKTGGHAFAIVGYDRQGFWVQNSWGPDWGVGGFCHLSYDDWLENGYDCWVARMGVPTRSAALEGEGSTGRLAGFEFLPHEDVVHAAIRPHYINLGNDGRFSASGRYSTDAAEAERLVTREIPERTSGWSGSRRLLLYAHGGLNNEKASASRIASLLPYFLANEIYPLHFMWESGLWQSLRGIVKDAFRGRRMEGWRDSLKERFFDLLDGAIELGARPLGRPVWSQMKDNARRASMDEGGGARFVAGKIAGLAGELGDLELHLAGHSAGSIFHAYLIPQLAELGLTVRTLTLWAPACTTRLFKTNILPHVGGPVRRLTLFNLTDPVERGDTVGGVYRKSLLYLASRSFERKGEPLLGMQRYVTKDRALRGALGAPVEQAGAGSAVIYSVGGPSVRLESRSESHGGFDNDEDTLNSLLRIVRGRNGLARPFVADGSAD